MSTTGKGRPGGVLPINVTGTKSSVIPPTGGKSSSKNTAPKLRLLLRRLPPGLTGDEFWSFLGDEWRVGGGKVEWAVFKEGKVSKDPSKPSRPARGYLKLKDSTLIESLVLKTKQTTFQDAKNTTKDLCLLGPPSLEFAPYNRVPSGRIRNDGRQGTIDQDQEFIDFLQNLTEPISKPAADNVENNEAKIEKVTTTPLVQFIKEKKASKAKEAMQPKGSKGKQETKEAKATKQISKSAVIIKGNANSNDKTRVAKATQDAVKAINRSVAAMQNKSNQNKTDTKPAAKEATAQVLVAKRERERGSASAAARMLQRDLGLTPKSPRTPRASAPNSSGTKPEATPLKSGTPAAQEVKPAPSTNSTPPTGPRNTRTSISTTAKPTAPPPPTTPRSTKASQQPSSGAKSAFLKHANPSQGVTEDLLRAAFEKFGKITRCEIDKKKGLGYIDFEDTEGLRNAMQASPVKVGNGQVLVLENRSPYPKRGQQAAQSANPVTKLPANGSVTSSNPSTAIASDPSAIITPPTVTEEPPTLAETSSAPATAAPNTPRSGPRGGSHGGRGGRGVAAGARSTSGQTSRGGSRSHRSGRGHSVQNQNRGGKAGTVTSTNGGSATTETTVPNTLAVESTAKPDSAPKSL